MRFSFPCLVPFFLFFEDLSESLGVSVLQSAWRSGNDEKEGTDILVELRNYCVNDCINFLLSTEHTRILLHMRPLTEDESKAVFTKLANYIAIIFFLFSSGQH